MHNTAARVGWIGAASSIHIFGAAVIVGSGGSLGDGCNGARRSVLVCWV